MNYEYFYKEKIEIVNNEIKSKDLVKKYDILISAYNSSERVNFLLKNIIAVEKHVFLLPEYEYTDNEIELNTDEFILHHETSYDESEVLFNFFIDNVVAKKEKEIAFDITGFLRPHIIYFVRLCREFKIKKIDFIYSEPENYVKKEDTSFSTDFDFIRDINGCSGNHNTNTTNDYLVIGCGYDYNMILKVAKEKKEAKKIQMLGFPSLQADMFQQNILKAYRAQDDMGTLTLGDDDILLSPANDPFITAQKLSDFIKKNNKKKEITNLYLCPLATKSQALGFALFYVTEKIDSSTSMIFPFCKGYSRETSEGISRFWIYTVEGFDLLD